MKRLLPIILILTLLLIGCGGSKEVNYNDLTVEETIKTLAEGKYEVDEIVEADNNYSVTLKAKLMSGKTARKELLMKTRDILQKLEGKDVDFINIEWQSELVDKHGNAEYRPVMYMELTEETLNKINWDNFDYKNLTEVADEYKEHQALGAGD